MTLNENAFAYFYIVKHWRVLKITKPFNLDNGSMLVYVYGPFTFILATNIIYRTSNNVCQCVSYSCYYRLIKINYVIEIAIITLLHDYIYSIYCLYNLFLPYGLITYCYNYTIAIAQLHYCI